MLLNQSQKHFSAFGNQHVVGSTGRCTGHGFQPNPFFNQRVELLGVNKAVLRACAQHHQFEVGHAKGREHVGIEVSETPNGPGRDFTALRQEQMLFVALPCDLDPTLARRFDAVV